MMKHWLIVSGIALALLGCGRHMENYERAKVAPPLKVPASFNAAAIHDEMVIPGMEERPVVVAQEVPVSSKEKKIPAAPSRMATTAPAGNAASMEANRSFFTAWHLTALALEKNSWQVQKTDRDQGVIWLTHLDNSKGGAKKYFWQKWKPWKLNAKNESNVTYLLHLKPLAENKTRLMLTDAAGQKVPDEVSDSLFSILRKKV